jgi:hypothetical protein
LGQSECHCERSEAISIGARESKIVSAVEQTARDFGEVAPPGSDPKEPRKDPTCLQPDLRR